jgi:hypothetical protein
MNKILLGIIIGAATAALWYNTTGKRTVTISRIITTTNEISVTNTETVSITQVIQKIVWVTNVSEKVIPIPVARPLPQNTTTPIVAKKVKTTDTNAKPVSKRSNIVPMNSGLRGPHNLPPTRDANGNTIKRHTKMDGTIVVSP